MAHRPVWEGAVLQGQISGYKSRGAPLMMESPDSTCWVTQESPAENSNSSPE